MNKMDFPRIVAAAFIALIASIIFCSPALASTTATNTVTGYSGSDAVSTIEGILYGGWGLVIGIIIFATAIGMFLKLGLGAALVVMALGVIIFLIPPIIEHAQEWGASQAGYTKTTR